MGEHGEDDLRGTTTFRFLPEPEPEYLPVRNLPACTSFQSGQQVTDIYQTGSFQNGQQHIGNYTNPETSDTAQNITNPEIFHSAQTLLTAYNLLTITVLTELDSFQGG